ncbi:MAG: M42 family metallopeptidase [Candidatus Izemoplasmatales bacterium]
MSTLLNKLTMLDGIPGNEQEVRDFMRQQAGTKAEITTDKLGSVILRKEGSDPEIKVMVAGHLDEIGFIVSEITKDGYLKFISAGGWWGHVVLSQQFTVTTRTKKKIRGVVGSKPPHILTPDERKKVVEINEMFLDIGVDSKKAAEALGIEIGNMITPYIEFQKLANKKYLLAKAFDNRVGIGVVLEVLELLQNTDHPNVFYGVGTVMEEVGLRGAQTSSYLVDPDIGVSIDVTIATDYPGGSKEVCLGKGPCLMVYDSSMVGHVSLREHIMSIAEEKKIPFQLSYLNRGGTDAGRIHLVKAGCPSIALCIPSRYIHSHTSIIHQDDYDQTVRLVHELLKSLDRDTVRKITYQ